LVFFKRVMSKTKFWQMIGRGTRLSPNLFGPDKHKQFFYVFDYCQNLEFFSQNPETIDGSTGESLAKRLFNLRLELIAELDKGSGEAAIVREEAEPDLRHATAELLRNEIAAMNVENFVVRPRRELVERFAEPKAWEKLSQTDFLDLSKDVAGLPTQLEPEDEEAKRFDVLMLNIQLAVLRADRQYSKLQKAVISIASLLEDKSSIPMVQQQMELILAIQTDEWWEHVTPQMLENARKRLRLLVKLIGKTERKPIYTDFEDVIGEEKEVGFAQFTAADEFEEFRRKARQFLREHEDHIAIHKLRMNEPLTAGDLAELERILAESGTGSAQAIHRAKTESDGLGLFVRSLVGMDRAAAKAAFAEFITDGSLASNQIEFVDMIIDHLTERGIVPVEALYTSPYTDVSPKGPDGLFKTREVDRIADVLDEVRSRAVA
ncbi:MAG: restriction endonuclease subunit R, partial [Chthoniobacterales bacterium]|nr:restriction endonuclease subunit R [Chthoniobacterales bacterium]